MTRIKCCGMTRVEDALLAARLGADAIGLVFTARSRRQVSLAQAQAIRRALPPFVASVALFMDDTPALIAEVIASVNPDLLQFHGQESNAECAHFGRPYLKAIAMGDGDAASRLRDYPGASALLLDGHGSGEAGGSGTSFDWTRTPRGLTQPLILAGGLRTDNVAVAIRLARPWAVDVASGVESAPGIKDAAMLSDFVAAVRAEDARGTQT
ncbi:MAG: phosphoribosylanthranilate isomerase [Rhodanobacter sp.]|nr:MAG: phosphoribosylanthranilate isomerase [Rhodanobacter sp.]TAM02822.1 MAG: phosphoribosylanthranilate isomerase [Rhodanobacter sp.]TAM42568.1 MAG: phosphoribosylanthranilate isomerase [Rhodanobacter sp.]TAN26225.1 MAG: phosphoribosylanthranilate isomerase [Rhodanobacter sp.]